MATNPERTGTGMGMGIEYGKPAPRFEQRKKKQDGRTTNLERTGIGMSLGMGDNKPAPALTENKEGRGDHQPRAHGHWHEHGHT